MGWRVRKSINLGGGAKTSMTSRGMGVSWGFAGFRIGRAPTGLLWVSFAIPGTGISFFKYISRQSQQTAQQQQTSVSANHPPCAVTNAQSVPLTANQRILEEIRQSKP
jgi:hypothetical protein